MSVDWLEAIEMLWYWKQQLVQLDTSGKTVHVDQYGPESVERIFEAQRAVGTQFPKDFAQFLCCLDGYRGFIHHTDIFSTQQFLDGTADALRKQPRVAAFLAKHRLGDKDVVPMGTNPDHSVVLLLFAPTCDFLPGGVIGLMRDGKESNAESFSHFFLHVIEETERMVMELTEKARHDH